MGRAGDRSPTGQGCEKLAVTVAEHLHILYPQVYTPLPFTRNESICKLGNVWPEFFQFVAFFLLTVGLLKIGATFLIHKNPSSAVGNGLGWFVPGIA